MVKDPTYLTHCVRILRGTSQPILAVASDGFRYVVKFANTPQGANVLFNESIGTELFRACKLPTPPWKPILVTDAFLDRTPDWWMEAPEGRRIPSKGYCFGSRFLGEDDIRLYDLLPTNYFGRIRNRDNFWLAWLIDICAGNTDRGQAIFRESKRHLEAVFIDHGNLFGGPRGEHPLDFFDSRVLVSRFNSPRIYSRPSPHLQSDLLKTLASVDGEQLWKRIRTVPDDWKTKSTLSVFEECLNRLQTVDLLQNMLAKMLDAQEREYSRVVDKVSELFPQGHLVPCGQM